MKDIFFSIIAFFCAGGACFFTLLFCIFATAMQRQEGEDKP